MAIVRPGDVWFLNAASIWENQGPLYSDGSQATYVEHLTPPGGGSYVVNGRTDVDGEYTSIQPAPGALGVIIRALVETNYPSIECVVAVASSTGRTSDLFYVPSSSRQWVFAPVSTAYDWLGSPSSVEIVLAGGAPPTPITPPEPFPSVYVGASGGSVHPDGYYCRVYEIELWVDEAPVVPPLQILQRDDGLGASSAPSVRPSSQQYDLSLNGTY